MQNIYFDESGQTGTHMSDANQPYFCLGSTCIEEDEAANIISKFFPRQQGPELKASSLLKGPKGRRNLLKFANVIAQRPHDFIVAKLGKRFVVVSKMVDWFVEPMLHDLGYDFYKNDYAAKFANSVGFCFEHLIDAAISREIFKQYNEFARKPTTEKISALADNLQLLQHSLDEPQSTFIGFIADGAKHFLSNQNLADWKDTNEIHVTAAVNCMEYWLERFAGPFHVIHDQSVHFFKHSERWRMMTDPKAKPLEVNIGEKYFRLPIPVSLTTEAKSHESASLQLCDLVAGMISRISHDMDPDFRNFAQQAIEEGLGELRVLPLDFGAEFASGPPEPADGPDIIDRIAIATRRSEDR